MYKSIEQIIADYLKREKILSVQDLVVKFTLRGDELTAIRGLMLISVGGL